MEKIDKLTEHLLFLKKGGGIHIKKKNRGKFTDYCGGTVTEECIRRGKNSSNPTTRKRATFAANSRRWKHQQGGIIYTTLTPTEEQSFQNWYKTYSMTHGLNSDPDNPEHYYDYRGYWKNDLEPQSLIFNEHLPDKWKLPGHPTYSNESVYKEGFVPTIDNLADFTGGFETFREQPYVLKTSDGKDQILAGYGSANPEIIQLAREGKLTKDIARKEMIKRLQYDYDEWGKQLPEFNNLPEDVKLALVDTSYNGKGVTGTIKTSPKLIQMIKSGVTDGKQLASQMDHSKTSDGWLGVRSSARRAMAQGKYNWNWDTLDKYGRQVDYDQYKGPQDYKSSPYYQKYQWGGLVYSPFNVKSITKQDNSQDEDISEYIRRSEDIFPVEPVRVWGFPGITFNDSVEEPKITRGVTEYKTDNIDVGNMREFLDKLEENGISVRVTSGTENRKTKQGKRSRHSTGDAIDITPIKGQTFADLVNQIKSKPDLLNWMRENRIGIIDETDPYIKTLTGATGDHFHVSKDINGRGEVLAINGFKKLFG